jgi:hypothetical protein
LRSRIDAAVAQLETSAESNQTRSRGRDFGGFFASLAGLFSFTPRGAAAFASLLAVVALALVYFSTQKSQQGPVRPQDGQQLAQVAPTSESPSALTPTPASSPDKVTTTPSTAPFKNHNPRRADVRNNVRREPAAVPTPKQDALPGEKDYQTAIASLEKTIKLGGDESLRPALRADYERNLALLDSAISQTRQVAARNPKDEVAVSFLMSAYQSKVELLSKVADQAQVATLGR